MGDSKIEEDMRNTVDKLLSQRAEKTRQQEVVIENMEEWQEVLNRIFTSDDGKLFAKYLLRHCGIFNKEDSTNHIKMIENIGKRNVYLELIRPYLDVLTRSEIENQG